MWGRKHIQRLWTIISAGSVAERGAAATEYAIILMAFAITVVAGLAFIGGAVGGSFAEVAIISPLDLASCKLGGWESLTHPETGEPMQNQGDCVSYENTGK